ncbi:Osmosensitive K+ channel histidine kinase KdpD [Klebsiella pneumoniae subsp. ozaenae]|uniref:Osmosensitive K+ channel histidine kinase KdpD n=1 Tax=Klebsiella pneumoniae subsp. ozaenae TaxID=574 RepID=A0A377Z654_KLEPO|nr:Osmosensitive K+ channel histidine kinase KdpD [Klebsiella pneumoniae subsp. ozaenae]
MVIALDEKPFPLAARASDSRPALEKWRLQLQGCAVAVALCAIITLVAMQWLMAFEAANLVMLYLLGVVLIALVYGRWPSVLATVINVISFDLFFVAPRGTLAVSDVQYLLTFGVMLTVGLLIGNLTAGVRYQARWRATVNAVPATCMRCLKRWRWVVASRISPPPASGLSPPPFRPAASCCSRTPRENCCP